ncbi:MAG: hypothetical protein R3A52_00795 [Polyangiales bacterium]
MSAAVMDDGPYVTSDPREAYERFRPVAEGLSEGEVQRFGAAASEVNRAVRAQVAAVRPHLDVVRAHAPWMDLRALQELPMLSLAVLYAASRVPGRGGGVFAAKCERLVSLRERALVFLDIAAAEGVIPVKVARSIGLEEGPIATARDAVAIAKVFRDYEMELGCCHPFKRSTLRALEDDGAWILSELTAGAEGRRTADGATLDRLGTLLAWGCEDLSVACVAVWGTAAAKERMGATLAALRGR